MPETGLGVAQVAYVSLRQAEILLNSGINVSCIQ